MWCFLPGFRPFCFSFLHLISLPFLYEIPVSHSLLHRLCMARQWPFCQGPEPCSPPPTNRWGDFRAVLRPGTHFSDWTIRNRHGDLDHLGIPLPPQRDFSNPCHRHDEYPGGTSGAGLIALGTMECAFCVDVYFVDLLPGICDV